MSPDADATSQMQEFASRTHQPGIPGKAADYLPAAMQLSAVPVRVERWLLDGEVVHRIVGLVWGGHTTTDKLQIRCGAEAWAPVTLCPPRSDQLT